MPTNELDDNLIMHKARLNELRRLQDYVEERIRRQRTECAKAKKLLDAHADIATQKHLLRKAIGALRDANKYLKGSHGADQLGIGEVNSSWNYDELIRHIIEGVKMVLSSFDGMCEE